jgi:hypothetical protein
VLWVSAERRGITALIQWLLNAVDWPSTTKVLGLINVGLCAPLYFGAINSSVLVMT